MLMHFSSVFNGIIWLYADVHVINQQVHAAHLLEAALAVAYAPGTQSKLGTATLADMISVYCSSGIAHYLCLLLQQLKIN
jgi:hypothetical protein